MDNCSLSTPRVSVLMTTCDGMETVKESIGSIFAQDMSDFELVIVDDASTDGTADLLRSIKDPRLVLVCNDERLGIVGARNRGLAHCRAQYIAALDHDDVSDPRRLGLQAAYLDRHSDVVLVGTGVRELRDGKLTPEDQPTRTSPALMRFLLHFDNPLAWSSVMLRAATLRGLDPTPLRPAFEPADDYDLYHRLLTRGSIARLDAPLTIYRWHGSNTSHSARTRITDAAVRVLTHAYAPWLEAEAAVAAALVVRHGNDRETVADRETMSRLFEIVRRVAGGLSRSNPTDREEVAAGARQVLWRLTRASVRSGRPLMFRLPAPPIDAVVSLAVGTLRSARGW